MVNSAEQWMLRTGDVVGNPQAAQVTVSDGFTQHGPPRLECHFFSIFLLQFICQRVTLHLLAA